MQNQPDNKLGVPKLQDKFITGFSKTRKVFIGFKELLPDPSLKVINHSPDGFAWGYGGSGPAQLALAILLNFMPEEMAKIWYQKFKREFVALLEMGKNFQVAEEEVDKWIAANIDLSND